MPWSLRRSPRFSESARPGINRWPLGSWRSCVTSSCCSSSIISSRWSRLRRSSPTCSPTVRTSKRWLTSRVRLRLSAEREYPVPPLGLAEEGQRGTADDLGRSGAVRLFVERAQAVKPDFILDIRECPGSGGGLWPVGRAPPRDRVGRRRESRSCACRHCLIAWSAVSPC